MRRVSLYLSLLGLASVLTFGSLGVASASSDLPVIQPRITAATSSSFPCASPGPCRVIATLTYNTAVGVAANAVPDFTVEDATNEQSCTVIAVTTAPPPSPIVILPSPNAIYLTMNCTANSGDVMLLVYRQSPALTAGYVYNATNPTVHALSPQAFAWFET